MAKSEDLILNAKVKGAGDVDKLADSFEKVDDSAKKAERSVADVVKTVSKLSGEDATIVLSLKGAEIKQEMEDIRIDLATLDSTDAEVDIKVARLNELRGDLDTVTSKLKELDAADVTVDVKADTSQVEGGLQRTKKGLDDTRNASDQTKSVLANMAGNTAQDLGELGGVVGSLGVGIGQMAEYATEGNISLSQLSKLAGPVGLLAAVSVGIGLFQKWKAAAAELEENTNQATEAFEEGVGAADDWKAAIDDAFETGTAGADAFSREILRVLEKALSKEQVDDLRIAMSDLGVTFADLSELTNTAEQDFAAYAAAQLEAEGATKQTADALGPLVAQYGNADEILDDLNNRLSFGAPLWDEYGNQIPIDEVIAFVENNKDVINSLDEVEEGFNRVDIEKAAQKFLQLERSIDPATRALVNQAIAQTRNADGTINHIAAMEQYIRAQQRRARADEEAATAAERQAARTAEFQQANTDAVIAAREEHERMTFTSEETAAALLAIQDPLTILPGLWGVLIKGFKTGGDDIAFTTAIVNQLAEATNLEPGEILTIVAEQAGAIDEAALDAAEAVEELGGALREAALEIGTATARADAFDEALAQINHEIPGLRELSEAQVMSDFAGGIDDIVTSLKDLPGSISDLPSDLVPDTWAESLDITEEQQALLDSLSGMAGQIQTEMGRAFEEGGAPRAVEWANATRTAIEDALRAAGITSQEVIDGIIGHVGLLPDQVDIEVNIAVREEQLAAVQALAAGLPNPPPIEFIAAINNQDPETALRILNEQLLEAAAPGGQAYQVDLVTNTDTAEIETVLTEVTRPRTAEVTAEGQNIDETGRELDTTAEERDTAIVAEADTAKAASDLLAETSKPRSASIIAKAYTLAAGLELDGVAADRNAEVWVRLPNIAAAERDLDRLAQDRYADIFVRQRAVGPAVTATAGPTTLAAPSLAPQAATEATGDLVAAGVAAPMSISPVTMTAPTAAVAPITNNFSVSVSAAVIGNPHEVDRAVAKALRRHVRLNGSRN